MKERRLKITRKQQKRLNIFLAECNGIKTALRSLSIALGASETAMWGFVNRISEDEIATRIVKGKTNAHIFLKDQEDSK